MANTATEVEVKKGAATRTYNHNHAAQNAGHAYTEQQPRSLKLLWFARLALLIW